MNQFWDSALPQNYYDKVVVDGLNNGRGIQANWHNITFSKICKLISDSGPHLDYACGPGTFIGNYLNKGSVGVDISKNQISFANKKYGSKGVFKNIEDFDYNNYKSHFESVTVIGLFEYLDNRESTELLDQLYDLLKPGGKLIITTPNYNITMRLLEKLSHLLGPINYSSQHKSKHQKESLNNLFKKSKFKEFRILKFLNLGILFSIVSLKLGINMVNLLDNIFKAKIGLLFLVEAKK